MLEVLTADALSPLRHGFFTRKGGASSGIFSGLNCGLGSSDLSEVVAINRARVAQSLGAEPEHLITLHQVHSANVISVTTPPAGERPKADALVTATPGIVLGVLTADCQPILFADPTAGVIGAAHAGWRGALMGVLEETLDAMEGLGARRANIRAVIGPTISQSAYEVGPEFVDRFVADDSDSHRYFNPGQGDRALFDLPGYSLNRLRVAGIGHVEWTQHCTFTDETRFFSFRRSTHRAEADYGRLISAIRL
jgi:polyphenol oxidase